MAELNEHDQNHVAEIARELARDKLSRGWADPEIAMTSLGYVEVYPDGVVVAFGKVIHRVDLLPPLPKS